MAKSKSKKGPKIEYCRISPAIGIGRLGNSPDQFFIGPEVPGDRTPRAATRLRSAA